METAADAGQTNWMEMPTTVSLPLPEPDPAISGAQTSGTSWTANSPSASSGWTPNLPAPNPPPDPNALLNYFGNVVSIDLVGDGGTHMTEIILPLCYSSGTVRDAACALAGLHMVRTSVGSTCDHALFHSQALVGLPLVARLDEDWARDQTLAALLLLVYYEVVSEFPKSLPAHSLIAHVLTISSCAAVSEGSFESCCSTSPTRMANIMLKIVHGHINFDPFRAGIGTPTLTLSPFW